jgi:hypothetical protein
MERIYIGEKANGRTRNDKRYGGSDKRRIKEQLRCKREVKSQRGTVMSKAL